MQLPCFKIRYSYAVGPGTGYFPADAGANDPHHIQIESVALITIDVINLAKLPEQ